MNDTLLELIEGDITELQVDAIVNPANEELQLGGGVAGAVREKGGVSIQDECDRIAGAGHHRGADRCAADAVALVLDRDAALLADGAGTLKAKQVIHAVGPRMGEGDEDRKLAAAVRAALALADRNGQRTIAIPAISTGLFGYPVDRCARILLTEVHRYLQGGTKLERVVVCLHGDENFKTFRTELRRGFR